MERRAGAFGDEAGGGGLPRCRAEDFPGTGAVWVFDVASGALLGSYKLPRFLAATCTMHNFNFVPGVERDILVSSAYTAGTTVADLTDPANPVGIAFYQAAGPPASNAWSSYWHNGFICANDVVRGLDVFSVDQPALGGAANLDSDRQCPPASAGTARRRAHAQPSRPPEEMACSAAIDGHSSLPWRRVRSSSHYP